MASRFDDWTRRYPATANLARLEQRGGNGRCGAAPSASSGWPAASPGSPRRRSGACPGRLARSTARSSRVSAPARAPLGYFYGDDGYGWRQRPSRSVAAAAAGGPALTLWRGPAPSSGSPISRSGSPPHDVRRRHARRGRGAGTAAAGPGEREALLATLERWRPATRSSFSSRPRDRRDAARNLEELGAAVGRSAGGAPLVAPRRAAWRAGSAKRATERRIPMEPAAAELLAAGRRVRP